MDLNIPISRYNVAAVVIDDCGRVLLCKRSLHKLIAPGNWHMPGGGIDGHEDPEQALTRELFEELSVSLVSVCATPIVHVYQIGNEYHQTRYLYANICGQIRLNQENDEHRFVSEDELVRYLPSDWLTPGQQALRWCFQQILNNINDHRR